MNTARSARIKHAVQPDTDAAGADLTELHVDQRHHPAERRVAVVHRVRPHRSTSRWSHAANSADAGAPNRISLPSKLPPGWVDVVAWFDAERRRPSGCRSTSNSVAEPGDDVQIVTITASST